MRIKLNDDNDDGDDDDDLKQKCVVSSEDFE